MSEEGLNEFFHPDKPGFIPFANTVTSIFDSYGEEYESGTIFDREIGIQARAVADKCKNNLFLVGLLSTVSTKAELSKAFISVARQLYDIEKPLKDSANLKEVLSFMSSEYAAAEPLRRYVDYMLGLKSHISESIGSNNYGKLFEESERALAEIHIDSIAKELAIQQRTEEGAAKIIAHLFWPETKTDVDSDLIDRVKAADFTDLILPTFESILFPEKGSCNIPKWLLGEKFEGSDHLPVQAFMMMNTGNVELNSRVFGPMLVTPLLHNQIKTFCRLIHGQYRIFSRLTKHSFSSAISTRGDELVDKFVGMMDFGSLIGLPYTEELARQVDEMGLQHSVRAGIANCVTLVPNDPTLCLEHSWPTRWMGIADSAELKESAPELRKILGSIKSDKLKSRLKILLDACPPDPVVVAAPQVEVEDEIAILEAKLASLRVVAAEKSKIVVVDEPDLRASTLISSENSISFGDGGWGSDLDMEQS